MPDWLGGHRHSVNWWVQMSRCGSLRSPAVGDWVNLMFSLFTLAISFLTIGSRREDYRRLIPPTTSHDISHEIAYLWCIAAQEIDHVLGSHMVILEYLF